MLKAPLAPFLFPQKGRAFILLQSFKSLALFRRIPLLTQPQYTPQKTNYGKVLRKASKIVYSFIHIIFTGCYWQ
jgi:hypothetical protein